MLLLKTQTRVLDAACSFLEEQAAASVSEGQMGWLHFLGNYKSHLALIFFFFEHSGQKICGKNPVVFSAYYK